MTPADHLRAARKLIEKPGNWTQQYCARDARELHVGFESPDAVCWCALGAIARCSGDARGNDEALSALEAVLGGQFISVFNDTHTHSEVLAAFDRAIELAERTP